MPPKTDNGQGNGNGGTVVPVMTIACVNDCPLFRHSISPITGRSMIYPYTKEYYGLTITITTDIPQSIYRFDLDSAVVVMGHDFPGALYNVIFHETDTDAIGAISAVDMVKRGVTVLCSGVGGVAAATSTMYDVLVTSTNTHPTGANTPSAPKIAGVTGSVIEVTPRNGAGAPKDMGLTCQVYIPFYHLYRSPTGTQHEYFNFQANQTISRGSAIMRFFHKVSINPSDTSVMSD